MTSELVPYTQGDDAFDAAVVRPEGDGPHPAVLVLHGWRGRSAFEEEKAHALSELGYVGVAADVYGVGQRGTDTESCRALMEPLLAEPNRLRARLGAAFEMVRSLPGVDGSKVGAIGFCFGGLCSVLMARMGLDLRGVVSFHGLLKTGEPLPGPVRARILLQHGQDDPMVPPSDVAAFAHEMKRMDADWQLHAYPGVMHAFTNPAANDPDFGTVYDVDADRRSWIEMERFFGDVFAH